MKFGLLGIVCFITYLAGIVLGEALIPNYSNFNQAISELFLYSNYRVVFNTIFTFFNISTLLYGFSIIISMKKKEISINAMATGLIMIALTGTLMFFYPMDPPGLRATLRGSTHLLLAAIMALLALFVTFEGFFAFNNRLIKYFSLISSISVLIFGLLTFVFVYKEIRIGFGLLERIAIGSYMTWVLATGIYFLKYNRTFAERAVDTGNQVIDK